MSKSKGFSTIELLVVIAIVSAFAIIVISNFPQINRQLALSRAAYKFDQDVRRAQNLAFSAGQFKDSLGNVQTVTGYGVYLDFSGLGNKKYVIYADKPIGSTTLRGITYPVGNQYYGSLDYLVETIDFSLQESGIIIKEIIAYQGGIGSSVNKISVNFNSADLSTLITIPPPPAQENKNSVDIVFSLESDLATIRTVSVNNAGSIIVK